MVAIRKAERTIPLETAKPIWMNELTPEIISDAKVPARMSAAAATVGPAV
jgi:hypothetical protein